MRLPTSELAMPPPSLLSLLPAASVSARGRRAPTASHHLAVRRGARAPSPLHVSPSSSSPVAGGGGDELHLLEKPSPSPEAEVEPDAEGETTTEEALAPFLKFFQVKSTDPDDDTVAAGGDGSVQEEAEEGTGRSIDGEGGSGVVHYDPKPGDLVVGVVVGGDARAVDIDLGAGGEPALMLAKEAVPVPGDEFGFLACDVASKDAAEFAAEGRVGVVASGGGVGQGDVAGGRRTGKGKGSPVVGVGTVVFAEVIGRTLGGRPLLSARRVFRRVAWHRVRQIKKLNVPIKVKFFEWNAGGLLSRIEGLRAFLPKAEMMTRPRNFTDLKNNVGREIDVCITKVDESTNELIISEKEAWAIAYLSEGTLLQGTVRKLFPYGAQIRIGKTNRGGLLHVSNITHGQLTSVGDVLKVGERVKALVIKSTAPDRIALSTKDLESEPGLFLSNKEKVFSEAEEMAQRYQDQISDTPQPDESGSSCNHFAPFDDEAESYANWKWLRFRKSEKTNSTSIIDSGL